MFSLAKVASDILFYVSRSGFIEAMWISFEAIKDASLLTLTTMDSVVSSFKRVI